MATFQILGITDERTECDCCGRTNLKCTVALDKCDAEGNATGEVVYFGRDCAAKATIGNNKSASMKIVESLARGIEYCRKWLHKTPAHTAAVVAAGCRARFCPAYDVGETISFTNGFVLK